jgi:hypothetical protein
MGRAGNLGRGGMGRAEAGGGGGAGVRDRMGLDETRWGRI